MPVLCKMHRAVIQIPRHLIKQFFHLIFHKPVYPFQQFCPSLITSHIIPVDHRFQDILLLMLFCTRIRPVLTAMKDLLHFLPHLLTTHLHMGSCLSKSHLLRTVPGLSSQAYRNLYKHQSLKFQKLLHPVHLFLYGTHFEVLSGILWTA